MKRGGVSLKIIIESNPEEIAALLLALKEQPLEESYLSAVSSQTSQPIRGITITIDPLEKLTIHDTQQE